MRYIANQCQWCVKKLGKATTDDAVSASIVQNKAIQTIKRAINSIAQGGLLLNQIVGTDRGEEQSCYNFHAFVHKQGHQHVGFPIFALSEVRFLFKGSEMLIGMTVIKQTCSLRG